MKQELVRSHNTVEMGSQEPEANNAFNKETSLRGTNLLNRVAVVAL